VGRQILRLDRGTTLVVMDHASSVGTGEQRRLPRLGRTGGHRPEERPQRGLPPVVDPLLLTTGTTTSCLPLPLVSSASWRARRRLSRSRRTTASSYESYRELSVSHTAVRPAPLPLAPPSGSS
jgi:hypothetical protein